jgi:hypothetical protein
MKWTGDVWRTAEMREVFKIWFGNLKGRNQWKDIDGRIIKKCISGKGVWGCGLDSHDSLNIGNQILVLILHRHVVMHFNECFKLHDWFSE